MLRQPSPRFRALQSMQPSVLDVPMADVLELMVAPPEDEGHAALPAPPAPTIPPLFIGQQQPPRPAEAPPQAKQRPPTAPPVAKPPAPAPPQAKPPAPAPPPPSTDAQQHPLASVPLKAPPSGVKAPPAVVLQARAAAPLTPPKAAPATTSDWLGASPPSPPPSPPKRPVYPAQMGASQPAEPPFPPPEALLKGCRSVSPLRPAPPPYPPPGTVVQAAAAAQPQMALDVRQLPRPMITPLAPQLHIAVTDDEIAAWARATVPMLQGKQQHNFCQLLRLSGVDPALDIETIMPVQLSAGPFLRMTWREGRNWQRATLWDHSKEAYVLSGAHGTTATGAASILRSRFISKMDFAGVYALMTEKAEAEWLSFTVNKVVEGGKNWAGVVIEVRARCRFAKAGYGGTDADAELVSQHVASHQSKSNGGRWCLPEPFVEFVGIWVPLTGTLCDELPGCRRDR